MKRLSLMEFPSIMTKPRRCGGFYIFCDGKVIGSVDRINSHKFGLRLHNVYWLSDGRIWRGGSTTKVFPRMKDALEYTDLLVTLMRIQPYDSEKEYLA